MHQNAPQRVGSACKKMLFSIAERPKEFREGGSFVCFCINYVTCFLMCSGKLDVLAKHTQLVYFDTSTNVALVKHFSGKSFHCKML